MKNFTHLHNHSDRSMLDGLQSPDEMVATAARLGQKAIGLTDHGNLHAAYAFHRASESHGITPIIGIEAYLAPVDRMEKSKVFWGTPDQRRDDLGGAGSYTHLSLWATNAEGLRNLYALTSDSYANGFYNKPRIDYNLLADHSAGLVASTGCPGGEVQTRLRLGQLTEAERAAGTLKEIFGSRLFCELMDHGIEVERRIRDDLLALAHRMAIPLLATNDTHYSKARHSGVHDALLCVGTQAKLSDKKRFRFGGRGYYLKPASEMYALFSGLEEACANTLLVAEMVEGYGELFERRDLMPRFPCPNGFDEESLLRYLATEGLRMKGLSGEPHYIERLDYELGVINKMGFPGYFLIVGDAVSWAKRNGVEVGPGRGSSAASLVCWVLGITAINPLEHDLVFERFLNPERVTMPDIDLDFDEKDRVVDYLSSKYGSGQVARISTIMELKSRNALKDSSRVYGASYMAGDMLAKALPKDLFGSPAPLAALTDTSQARYGEMDQLRKLSAETKYARIVDMASSLEGTVRGVGIHAGGVVVSRRPLVMDVPLAVQSNKAVTQYDMIEVESLGLLKIDALGLSTLGTLRRSLLSTGVDRNAVPQDDRDTWALLASGHTTGIFQLESPGMQNALRQIKPSNLGDLAAVIALYRPGPMHSIPAYAARKAGEESVEPIHPELKEVLAPSLGATYHLLVFQEQVMQVARDVCGYSLGEADLLRRAMGKKDKKKLAKERDRFFGGGAERGHSEEALESLWAALMPFADYGFAKPHAVAYATTGYLAAYLKAHHPAQFMAAHLETVRSKTDKDEEKDKFLLALAEVRRMGIKLLPPDIHQAFSGFRSEDDGIRYGLDVVKGVGTAAAEDIAASAPYSSLLDYMIRAGKGKNAGAVKALASAGAMPNLGTRKGIFEAVPLMAKRIGQVKKYKSRDNSLTEENVGVPVGVDEYDQNTILAKEKDVLGTYVSAHPLDGYRKTISSANATPCGELQALPLGTRVTIIGTVASAAEKTTKNNKPFGSVKVADDTGDVRFSVWTWSRNGAITWDKAKAIATPGAVVKVTGRWAESKSSFVGLEVNQIERLSTPERSESGSGAVLTDFMLWWARKGVPVLAQEGRSPSLFGGILDATTDEKVIRHMAANPRVTGYGIRCGRITGILGIDLDVKHGIDGVVNFVELAQGRKAAIPPTMITATPSGGKHILLKVPEKAWEWLHSTQNNELGIDLRCEGITGPGSRNESGLYKPANDVREIAEASPEMLSVLKDLCERSPKREVDYEQDVHEDNMKMQALFKVGSVDEREVAAAQAALDRMIRAQVKNIARFAGMPEGSGLTGQVHSSACALGHYVPVYLAWDKACRILLDAAMDARPDGDENAFMRSIRRGLLYGAAKPERIDSEVADADHDELGLDFEVPLPATRAGSPVAA